MGLSVLSWCLQHSLGSLFRFFLLFPLHGLDHGDLFGLFLLVPCFKLQPEFSQRKMQMRKRASSVLDTNQLCPIIHLEYVKEYVLKVGICTCF